jgi:hypothetical protein
MAAEEGRQEPIETLPPLLGWNHEIGWRHG